MRVVGRVLRKLSNNTPIFLMFWLFFAIVLFYGPRNDVISAPVFNPKGRQCIVVTDSKPCLWTIYHDMRDR